MPTKIRLQRHGKKGSAFFHIVIADNRAPRDGKFIEKIGTYNPNSNPASIDLKFDRALNWLQTGAQPSDTVRAILSYEGVLFKNHLNKGVLKGAFTQDDADKRFEVWKNEKLGKIQSKVSSLDKAKSEQLAARLKAEEEVNTKRKQAIMAKTSALAEEANRATQSAESQVETEVTENVEAESTVEVTAETTTEVVVEAEAPVAEAPAVTEETSTEETKEDDAEKTV